MEAYSKCSAEKHSAVRGTPPGRGIFIPTDGCLLISAVRLLTVSCNKSKAFQTLFSYAVRVHPRAHTQQTWPLAAYNRRPHILL